MSLNIIRAACVLTSQMARKRKLYHVMVEMLVRLGASPDRVDGIVDALRGVMRAAQQARGCDFAGVFLSAYDRQQIVYVEDWEDERQLRQQFETARFLRLLELLEMASNRPVVEFRVLSETHGLEYLSSEGTTSELHHV